MFARRRLLLADSSEALFSSPAGSEEADASTPSHAAAGGRPEEPRRPLFGGGRRREEAPAKPPWRAALDFLLPGSDHQPPKKPRSPLLGDDPSGSFFPSDAAGAGGVMAPPPARPPPHRVDSAARRRAGPGAPWDLRAWKKFTLDVYVRLLERPRDSRLRIKQTVALLPFFKLKPVLDMSADPRWSAPLRARLDVKALGCLVLRVRPDGAATVFVRARAPLRDPRFAMDVVYRRDLQTDADSVKITFRALDVAFLKGPPRFGGGCKIPVHFARGVKSTLRVKKYILDSSAPEARRGKVAAAGASSIHASSSAPRGARQGWFDNRRPPEIAHPSRPLGRPRASPPSRHSGSQGPRRLGIYGPAGLDVKMRLWEFGSESPGSVASS